MNLTDTLIKEKKLSLPSDDTLKEHHMASIVIPNKKPMQLPKLQGPKSSEERFVVLKAAGAALVDGAEMVSEFAVDAVLGMGVLAKRAVGKKEIMPRMCDDKRAKRAACLLGFLLATAAVFGVYKVGKHYGSRDPHSEQPAKTMDWARAQMSGSRK